MLKNGRNMFKKKKKLSFREVSASLVLKALLIPHRCWKLLYKTVLCITKLQATYWTLQDLGDPFLLLHHTEVLPQIRWQGPAAKVVLRVALWVKVAFLGVVAGQRQCQGPGHLPHIHQTHVFTETTPPTSLFWGREEKKTSRLFSQSGCQGNNRCSFSWKVTHNYRDKDKREASTLKEWCWFKTKSVRRTPITIFPGAFCGGCCRSAVYPGHF